MLEHLGVNLAFLIVGLESLDNEVIRVIAISSHLLLEHLHHVVIGAGTSDLAKETIKNPVLAYKVDTTSPKEKESPVIQEKRPRLEAARPSPPAPRRQIIGGTLGHEMILKVRVAGNDDPDYIEIELPGASLSLEALILTAASELEVEAGQVERVRRMPNTRLRRDKEA